MNITVTPYWFGLKLTDCDVVFNVFTDDYSERDVVAGVTIQDFRVRRQAISEIEYVPLFACYIEGYKL